MKDITIDLKVNKKAKTAEIKMKGQLNISNISFVYDELSKTLSSKKITLSIDEVDDIDVSFIQTLESFKSKCKESNIELNLTSILNDDLTALLTRAGLQNL